MVGVLDRKLRRDLYGSRGLIVAITGIIAVGIACYGALAASYRNLSQGQTAYYNLCRMADFSIELKKAPVADLEALADLPGVIELRPRIQSYVTVDLADVIEPVNGVVLSLPDRREAVINDIVLRQGSYFSDRRANEVIVNESLARRHGLYPGQWIHILLNNRRQELFIVGTAISSEFTYLLGPGQITPDPEHFGVFYIKQSFAEEVFDFDGAANQVLGLLAPDVRARPADLLRRAESLLEAYGVASATPRADQPSHRFLANEIEGLRAFGRIMPTIFLVTASLVLNMLMTRLVEQQRTVVGTLKALGYGDWDVFLHFLKFGMAVGLLGGLAGCVAAYGMAAMMTGMYRQFFQFPRLVNQVYADIFATAVCISLAFGLIGSLAGARRVLLLEPAQAMRAKPPAQGGAVALERLHGLWNRLSFGWRMTLRNLIRHRLRTSAGVFAAAMGASVSVNALMMSAATNYLLDFQFRFIQRSDVDLVFKDERSFEAIDEVRHLRGVDYVEPTFDVPCKFIHGPYVRKGGVFGLSPSARLTMPRDARARRLRVPESGILINRMLAEALHVSSGNYVTVEPTRGAREPKRVRVAAISDSFLGMSVYADIDFLNQLMGEEMAVTGAQLSVARQPRELVNLYRELKRIPGIQTITVRDDLIENLMETLIKNQRVFITLLVGFAGVIFFGSVLNASLISLAERQREVATFRVLGYGEWQISWLFLRESLFMNLAGTLVGLPLGYLLSWSVAQSYNTEWFRMPLVDPRGVWLTTLGVGLAFGLAAHVFVHRAIARMDWLEALKTRE